jgi:hypothetical protein
MRLGKYVYPAFAVAFGAAWHVDSFTRRWLIYDRQDAGAVAGRAEDHTTEDLLALRINQPWNRLEIGTTLRQPVDIAGL